MALQERDADITGGVSFQDLHTRWLALGRVVYRWADRRDSAVDRAWWRMQGARFYRPPVLKAEEADGSKVPEVVSP